MKMKHEINIHKYFPKKFIRKTDKNQIICTECKGVGWIINKEKKFCTISHCHICHGQGILNLCSHCKKLPKYNYCNCDGAKKEREKKEVERYQKKFDAAKKISTKKEIVENDIEYLYCWQHDKIYDWDEIEDSELELKIEGITWMFGTYKHQIQIDADDVIQSACESCELHEEAENSISQDAWNTLNNFLKEWCEEQDGTITYSCDEKVVVLLNGDKNG